jgi:hypothetical protein
MTGHAPAQKHNTSSFPAVFFMVIPLHRLKIQSND